MPISSVTPLRSWLVQLRPPDRPGAPCGRGNWRIALFILAATLLSVSTQSVVAAQKTQGKLALTTTSFEAAGNIPRQFTCDGADISPALSWSNPPAATKSFVLIMDDPDAPSGTFVHWIAYNLPASLRQLPEHVPVDKLVRDGGLQGLNDFPKTGYGGPCPPPGKPHRYFIRLYALDTMLGLEAKAHRMDVDNAMQGHVLSQAELIGLYRR